MSISSTTHCGRGDRSMTLGLVSGEEQVERRDLNRYYALLEDELERVELSEPEGCFLVEALNGLAVDATWYRSLRMIVSDACTEDGLDEKWQINRQKLEAKLERITPGQAMALVDAAERFWERSADAELSALKLLHEVGVL